ncbi:hypothetical protein HDU67_007539 [Dinochytrium kinnereticum]|nr:hypothetical protein HDU67_007539 [Dinochytrium kinnereticum]
MEKLLEPFKASSSPSAAAAAARVMALMGSLLYAHHLRTHLRIPITLLLKPTNPLTPPQKKTLTLIPPASPPTTPNLHPSTTQVDAEPSNTPGHPIDLLLITTKAQDTVQALTPLLSQRRITPTTTIVLIQNGVLAVSERVVKLVTPLEQHQRLCDVLRGRRSSVVDSPRVRLVVGSCSHGVMRERWGGGAGDSVVVRHVGVGRTVLGAPFGRGEGVREALEVFGGVEGVGGEVGEWEEVRRWLMLKLAINATLNPLTALTTGLNGDIITTPQGLTLLRHLSTELAPLLDMTPQALFTHIHDVSEKTRLNRNSMEVDVCEGRETEVGVFVGYLGEVARERGVEILRGLVELRVECLRMGREREGKGRL